MQRNTVHDSGPQGANPPTEETRCKSPQYYLSSWLCMFKYRMGCRAIKEFQRQEKEGGKGGRRSATVVEERAPAVNGCGRHAAEAAGRNPENRASGGLPLVQSSRFWLWVFPGHDCTWDSRNSTSSGSPASGLIWESYSTSEIFVSPLTSSEPMACCRRCWDSQVCAGLTGQHCFGWTQELCFLALELLCRHLEGGWGELPRVLLQVQAWKCQEVHTPLGQTLAKGNLGAMQEVHAPLFCPLSWQLWRRFTHFLRGSPEGSRLLRVTSSLTYTVLTFLPSVSQFQVPQ